MEAQTSSQTQTSNGGPPAIGVLRTGDLLFPRPKDGWVPYLYQTTAHGRQTYGEETRTWRNIRAKISKGAGNIPAEARQRIGNMSYDEFRAAYGGGGNPGLFGIDFYTGHVAIFDGGNVIEALWGSIDKVIERPYSDWAQEHADHYVWLSRLTGLKEPDGQKFVKVARSEVGKPYDFFDFNLDDDSGFYCSKLVWFAVQRGLGIAMDDDSNPSRLFWYSPKQLLHSAHLTAIQVPGNY